MIHRPKIIIDPCVTHGISDILISLCYVFIFIPLISFPVFLDSEILSYLLCSLVTAFVCLFILPFKHTLFYLPLPIHLVDWFMENITIPWLLYNKDSQVEISIPAWKSRTAQLTKYHLATSLGYLLGISNSKQSKTLSKQLYLILIY